MLDERLHMRNAAQRKRERERGLLRGREYEPPPPNG